MEEILLVLLVIRRVELAMELETQLVSAALVHCSSMGLTYAQQVVEMGSTQYLLPHALFVILTARLALEHRLIVCPAGSSLPIRPTFTLTSSATRLVLLGATRTQAGRSCV